MEKTANRSLIFQIGLQLWCLNRCNLVRTDTWCINESALLFCHSHGAVTVKHHALGDD